MNYLNLTSTEKEKLKSKILTELFNSNIVHKKVSGIVDRNGIKHSTLIHEDVLSTTFMYLSEKPAIEILSMYYDDGNKPQGHLNRLVGLSVRIAIFKGVAKSSTNPDYPAHSVAKQILFASNLQKTDFISTENDCEHQDNVTSHALNIADPSTEENEVEIDLWMLIRANLDDEDLNFLEWFLEHKKSQGRYKAVIKEKYNRLVGNIKRIINEHAVNVPSPISKGYRKENFNSIKQKNIYIMNQETLFNNIQELLSVLQEFRTKGTAKISNDQKVLLQQTYNEIFPGVRVDVACTTCVIHYLSMLESYYEREYPKFSSRLGQDLQLQEMKEVEALKAKLMLDELTQKEVPAPKKGRGKK